jgi:gas vesicle protein
MSAQTLLFGIGVIVLVVACAAALLFSDNEDKKNHKRA